MRLWIVKLALPIVGGFLGAALPIGIVSKATLSPLATFLGLIAASILPTIGLLISSIDSKNRSVLSVDKLIGEIKSLTKNLLYILLIVILAVIFLLALVSPSPTFLVTLIENEETRILVGQIGLFSLIGHALDRTIVIPNSIFRCINYRAATASGEARKRTNENAPTAQVIKSGFAKKQGFGEQIALKDVDPD